jgi:hypothetical protein
MRKTFNFYKKIIDRLGGIIYALTLLRLGIMESGESRHCGGSESSFVGLERVANEASGREW